MREAPSVSKIEDRPVMRKRLAELGPAQDIVAYCRGAYFVLAYEAVEALRAKGFKARRLEDGLPEWRAARLPILSDPIERKI
jgi:rhodanese-related sulfurtransferase